MFFFLLTSSFELFLEKKNGNGRDLAHEERVREAVAAGRSSVGGALVGEELDDDDDDELRRLSSRDEETAIRDDLDDADDDDEGDLGVVGGVDVEAGVGVGGTVRSIAALEDNEAAGFPDDEMVATADDEDFYDDGGFEEVEEEDDGEEEGGGGQARGRYRSLPEGEVEDDVREDDFLRGPSPSSSGSGGGGGVGRGHGGR